MESQSLVHIHSPEWMIYSKVQSTRPMSTIDLKYEYQQINVHPADRDKTAFICPFGTFRFKKMPFGFRNAPATFQRLMDMFCRNLLAMAYLDDIIVLSPTFDQHLLDLETVFLKLKDHKLGANRSKCHFACSRVKYLRLWITSRGIEADPDKVSAVQEIPPLGNVKQVQ
ncbi:Retrovirus-related Pol polyprotein from transposon opus [Araneus ventricosus]|uniref:Retrovirus-related Pol polyprotein from transposon opus n=1 Tax=Araneus ventricosus TaxID=182803 RepID=A0A4Y2LSM5_ARAVE|nr:Retrovirus-related Pol polyprotein from transposon opus [Araneus ventricosus]